MNLTKPWQLFVSDTDLTVHIIPYQDSGEHYCIPECPCKPRVIEHGESIIYVHNSYDGRENLEIDSKIRMN
jgi:hypothetical protein